MIQKNPTTWKTKLPVKSLGSGSINDIVTLGKELGRGSFGVVYKAKYNDHGKMIDVAVKEQNMKGVRPHTLESLKVEIEALYDAKSCNIPYIYDIIYDSVREKLYFIMELLVGMNLSEYVKGKDRTRPHRNPVQTDSRAMLISDQLVSGLKCLHDHGIAHRDFKLANTMINPENLDVKIIDFGLSCIGRCEPTTVGTQITMAPEVIMKTVKSGMWPATDVWSLGCSLYTLVTQKYYPLQTKISPHYRSLRSASDPVDKAMIKRKIQWIYDHTGPPDLSAVNSTKFPSVMKLLKVCLIVDPDERWKAWKEYTKNVKY